MSGTVSALGNNKSQWPWPECTGSFLREVWPLAYQSLCHSFIRNVHDEWICCRAAFDLKNLCNGNQGPLHSLRGRTRSQWESPQGGPLRDAQRLPRGLQRSLDQASRSPPAQLIVARIGSGGRCTGTGVIRVPVADTGNTEHDGIFSRLGNPLFGAFYQDGHTFLTGLTKPRCWDHHGQ